MSVFKKRPHTDDGNESQKKPKYDVEQLSINSEGLVAFREQRSACTPSGRFNLDLDVFKWEGIKNVPDISACVVLCCDYLESNLEQGNDHLTEFRAFFNALCNYVKDKGCASLPSITQLRMSLLNGEIMTLPPITTEDIKASLKALLTAGDQNNDNSIWKLADQLQEIIRCFGNTIDVPSTMEIASVNIDPKFNVHIDKKMIAIALQRPMLVQFVKEKAEDTGIKRNPYFRYRVSSKDCEAIARAISSVITFNPTEDEGGLTMEDVLYSNFVYVSVKQIKTDTKLDESPEFDKTGFARVNSIGIFISGDKYSIKMYTDDLIYINTTHMKS